MAQVSRFMEEGLFILDRMGRMVFLNAQGERILGWRLEALRGSIAHHRIHQPTSVDDADALARCPIHKCTQDGQVYHIEEDIFIHRDGRMIPVSFVSSPLKDNDQIVGSVTLFKKTGRRREMEREIKQATDIALETARLKSEFLANMSHEVRTPINGVIGMTSLLLDSKLNKDQKELALTARDSAQALLTIVDDILDFSSIETSKLEIKAEDFRLSKVVEAVAGLLASQAQRKNLSLATNLSSKIPSMLQGDPARIRQVLLNLVGNALKFTKKGGVNIRVRLEKKTKVQAVVRFAVSDTGIGIPKSAQHRLFQPFAQVDGSSTRPYGGVGLGLSIANRLVELMGGQIGYTPRKVKGSIFWFSIPLVRSRNVPEPDTQSALTPAALRGVKVLIVDAQQTTQTVLLNQVLRWRMKGTSVESAEEIMDYLTHEAATETPCALIMVSSPPDGKEQMQRDLAVARAILQGSHVPPVKLVLVTGNNDKKYLEEARVAGYAAVVGKPIQRDRLLETLLSLVHSEPPVHAMATSITHAAVLPETTTTLCHPAVAWHDQQSVGEEARTHAADACRILLAEDNAVIQKVAQIQLHRLGFIVQTVANGKEAVEAMRKTSFSLVLMDCHMPVMDGYQATRTIRAAAASEIPNGSAVPIVGMLAKTVKGELKRCLDVGMNRVLLKPIQMENLKEVLAHWLA